VGEKTFGKGSVQVVMPVGEGEALRLTVARYYLPSGRTIQAVGVTPDITVHPGKVARDDNLTFMIKEQELKRHLEGELEKVNGKKDEEVKKEKALDVTETLEDDHNKTVITEDKIYDDAQLKSAIDILRALIITNKPKEETK
jgi:carboxyl-terminal processing protease